MINHTKLSSQLKRANYVTSGGFNKNVNYAYNGVGALNGIGTNLIGTDPNTTTNVLTGAQYNGFGALKTVNYGNNRRLTLGYDASRHQMTSMVVDNQNGTDPIISKAYQYVTSTGYGQPNDNDGRIKKITDNIDGAYTKTYSYDEHNRLTNASSSAANRNYIYDAWGNIEEMWDATWATPSNQYTLPTNGTGAPATNRMSVVTTRNAWWQVLSTTNYTWDAAGNMTGEGATSFQYDAASRLKTVNNGTTETNGFDGDSQRVKKVEGSVTVFYVRSSVMKQTAFEVGGNGALYRANVYKSQNRLVAQLASDGSFYWQHKNHLGSGYKLTNSAGAVVYRAEHDPHGQLLLETGSTTLTANKFTSYERDNSTGLDYANARMYASARGRFTSPDPSGMQYINTRNPESLNRYAYTGNDPVNYIDPTGLVRVFDEDICEKWGFLFPEAAKEWGCGTGNSDPRTKDGGRGGSSGGVGATYPNVRFNEIHVSVIREIVQPNNYGVASLAFPTQEFCEEGATYELKIDVGYESIREFIQSESKVRAKGDIKILEYSFDFLNSSGDGLGEVYIKFSFKDKSVASSRIGVEVGFVGKTHDKAKGNNGLSIIVSCKT